MKLILPFVLAIMLGSCGMDNDETTKGQTIEIENLDAAIEALSKKRIYFGHHSVGYNILAGLEGLVSESQAAKIMILDSQDPGDYENNMLGHSRIGYNEDPVSKIIGFSNFIDNLSVWEPDIAMFKFCYVDFSTQTDIEKIFAEYKFRMERLKEKHPDMTFVHITVPLTTIQTGLKAELKKIFGKPVSGVEANVIRNNYNELLRSTFGSRGAIFDLAQIESTFPDGARSQFKVDDKVYYSLADTYSSDGGHLNQEGQKVVAVKFLQFLSEIAGK